MIKKNILLYCLEFFLSLIVGILSFRYGIDRKILWVILAFAAFIILGINFYHLYRLNSKKMEHIFLMLAIPIGILYSLFLAPFRIADDAAQIIKNIDLSQGHLFTRKDSDNKAIVDVPRAFDVKYHVTMLKIKPFYNIIKTDTNYNDLYRVRNEFTYTVINMPTNYMFSSLGLKLGSLLNLNLYISLYIAKLFNLIFFWIIGYIMIKIFPFKKIFLLVYLFNPMMLQTMSSIGADCFTNLVCLLWISYILYLKFDKKKVETIDTFYLFILMVMLATAKFIYFPLLLLLCLIKNLYQNKKDRKIVLFSVFLSLIVVGVGIYIGIGYKCDFATVVSKNDIDSIGQLKNVLTKPWNFIIAIVNSIYKRQGNYFSEFFGKILGSYHILLMFIPYILYIGLFFITMFMDRKDYFDKASKYLILFVTFILVMCVFGVEYLTWNSVGSHFISGVQGRYFLPFMLLPFIIIATDKIRIKFKDSTRFVTLMIIIIQLMNIFVLYRSYM